MTDKAITRRNEKARYLARPPRSTKKKNMHGDSFEVLEESRVKIQDSIGFVRCSLEFMGSYYETADMSDAGDEASTQKTG